MRVYISPKKKNILILQGYINPQSLHNLFLELSLAYFCISLTKKISHDSEFLTNPSKEVLTRKVQLHCNRRKMFNFPKSQKWWKQIPSQKLTGITFEINWNHEMFNPSAQTMGILRRQFVSILIDKSLNKTPSPKIHTHIFYFSYYNPKKTI